MRNRAWFADRVFWGVLAAGLVVVALLRSWLGAGARPDLQALILLIAVYPLLEEIVFRGMLQPALQRRTRGVRLGPLSLANLLTSIMFAVAHLPAHGIPVAAMVFGPSLVFGLFRERHGTLASPAFLHVSWNAASVLLLGRVTTPIW